MRYGKTNQSLSGPEIQKQLITEFWDRFGERRKNGAGYQETEKLSALIALAKVKIPYKRQQHLSSRRDKFNDVKNDRYPWRRFGQCFVCGNPATSRHHIIQLQHGGINSKKNVVPLCDPCHAKIHPWLTG